MPHEHISKELIERFFRKECTAEEANKVAAYLKANPHVLEEYLSVEEWNEFVPADPEDDENWNATWQNIKSINRKRDVMRTMKRVAAAASVIILVVAATYYAIDKPVQKSPPVIAKKGLDTSASKQYKIVKNNTKTKMHITLDDNSSVELSPASSIQYETVFGKTKRDILLEGEARFTVTKNKAKPFTVYAGGFTTTALGTVFIVQENSASKTFSVQLSEGRVVVRSIKNNVTGWQQDVYLIPGEQLIFNQLSGQLAINKKTEQKKNLIAREPSKKSSAIDSTYDQLNFNNASLPEVMHTLKGWFNISIVYDSSAIHTMNFSGLVSRYDSPETILKVISLSNGLDVSKNDTAFIIYKPQ